MTRTARLWAALGINVALVVAEVAAGVVGHSSALLADGGHNLADVVAVAGALAAVRWALRPRSEVRSFGNHRGTILAALGNAALLSVITFAIVALGIDRLVHPGAVDGGLLAGVAGAALLANAAAAWVLREREQHRDMNMRSVTLHMVGDTAASGAAVLAGVLILVVGDAAARADAAASLVVAVLIGLQAVRLMRESADVLLESTPADVDLASLRRAVTGVTGVGEVHDLHVWSLSSDYRALSAHLVLQGHPTLEDAQAVGGLVRERMLEDFGIAHTTFEMECERCDDETPDPCTIDDLHAGAPTSELTRGAVAGGTGSGLPA
ncbi:MAG: cation diffusion facilitator family transporter [Acidimicrobiales bacterium]